MANIMVDLETLGTGSNAAIVSIGAVKFTSKGLGEEFYANIDMDSCQKAGLHIDGNTVLWWLKQSEEARAALLSEPRESLFAALNGLAKFIGDPKKAKIWGNGATFDNVILGNAYDAVNLDRPWMFWNDCCYRTVKNLLGQGIEFVPPEVAHDALSDAKAQAAHLVKILNAIAGG